MKNKLITFTGSVLLFTSSLVFAESSDVQKVEPWLQKMHSAAHMGNYQGVFVYGQSDNLSSMKIVHSTTGLGERERLLSLDGTGREVIRNKNSVTCILPDSNSVMVEKNRPKSNFPPAFPVKLSSLVDIYDFHLAGSEVVAGQPAQKINIMPRDQYRYGHTLWIDKSSGLLLKTHLVNERGHIVEKFMFTQIEYMDSVPDKLLKPSISGENFTWYESDEANKRTTSTPSKWNVKRLPKGFKEDMSRKHVMPRSGVALEQLMFSDGLSSVSVFIEKHANNDEQILGYSRMGAINACGRVLDNNIHVTVVGEVTHAAVKMMCDSVYSK